MPTLPFLPGPRMDPSEWPDRYGDRLFRFALARLVDPDAAADLVQETFLAALQSHGGFAGASAEFTWLVGILKHKVLDYRRRALRRKETLLVDPFNCWSGWRERPSDWSANADDAMERAELREVLRACLDALPSQLAEAFVLREVEGRGAPELCEQLGIAATNLWTRLYRARLHLRDCLERNWFRDPPPVRSMSK